MGIVIGVIGGMLAPAVDVLITKRRRMHRVRRGGSDVNIDEDASPGHDGTADPFELREVSKDLAFI